MEPRIQYARTSDGVNIAFWTLGKGPPLVTGPGGISHCQLEWNIAECVAPGMKRWPCATNSWCSTPAELVCRTVT